MKTVSFLFVCVLMCVLTGCAHYIPVWTATYNSKGEKIQNTFQPPAGYAWDEIVPQHVVVEKTGSPEKAGNAGDRDNTRRSASITLRNSPLQAVGVFYTFQWLDKDGVVIDSAGENKQYIVIPANESKALESVGNNSDAADWRVFVELLH